jgi:photosystem II stability/assembly factor-like uncharacterized protein
MRRMGAGKAAAWGLMAMAGLAACMKAPDLAAVRATDQQSVRRYDTIQALASNAGTVVAATQDGVMLTSRDAGKTWSRQALGSTSIIGMATCPDGSYIGIDFYHRIWSAGPDGAAWKSRPLAKPQTALTVACDAKGTWWVAGTRATIASSSDQGASWKLTDLGQDAQFTALQFESDSFGIAMGEFGMVVVTTDGGAHWTLRPKLANDFYPYAALFTSERDGWVSGLAGQILVTHDGARSWQAQENETRQALYRLFLHQGVPYGAGAGGVLARLDGASWREVAYPDAIPVFLGAATSVEKRAVIAIGGPAGVLRAIGTQAN